MTVWLHIGTAKSGTTSLQRALRDNGELLAQNGLRYTVPNGAASSNALAVALNRNRPKDIARIGEGLSSQLAEAETAIISSEMLYGIDPQRLLDALPQLRDRALNVLIYVRRQDRYIESKYVQKLKNGAFRGDLEAFIKRFEGSGSDYRAHIAPWRRTHATLHLRVCEPAKLHGGSTVTDALALIGSPELAQQLPQQRTANTSPSLTQIQLLQALQDAGHPRLKRIQRALPSNSGAKARFMDNAQRRAFLDQHTDANEDLRAQFYPDAPSLFETSDLLEPDPPKQQGFTAQQLVEIETVFRLVLEGK